jgi:hypothetical protein
MGRPRDHRVVLFVFFSAMCSAINSARTSSLACTFFSKNTGSATYRIQQRAPLKSPWHRSGLSGVVSGAVRIDKSLPRAILTGSTPATVPARNGRSPQVNTGAIAKSAPTTGRSGIEISQQVPGERQVRVELQNPQRINAGLVYLAGPAIRTHQVHPDTALLGGPLERAFP